MKIFLIRHGESTSDVENRYGGDYDDHLTEKGKRQALELVDDLKAFGIQKIFSSPRLRVKETADILSEILNCELQINYDLRERNAYGILTGMVKEQAKSKYPEQVKMLIDYKSTIEGAETYEHLFERVRNVLQEITNTPYETIAIISHGGFMRCVFRDILNIGELKELGDCAFVELEKSDSNFEIIKMKGISI